MKTKAPRRSAKPFNAKVSMSLRYIVRLTADGVASECIDAGALGIGATQQESLRDLIECLDSLYDAAKDHNLRMIVPARDEDERLFAHLAAGQSTDPSILGFGVIQRIELVPTAAGRELKVPASATFEVSRHTSLAA